MSYAVLINLKIEDDSEQRYNEIGNFLRSNGFVHQQGSLYFGDETIDAVRCVLMIQKLSRKLTWLSQCVTDIRMLRIEENNNLMPALEV
ncbi:MAG: virulence factor [Synergistaceae bacterium]|nr:virulence factor [Synergistaceae bacterium]